MLCSTVKPLPKRSWAKQLTQLELHSLDDVTLGLLNLKAFCARYF